MCHCVDIHHHEIHCAHHVADHREISRLRDETSKLIVSRNQLQRTNTKSAEQIAEMKRIEDELRENISSLMSEMQKKEQLATATNDELRLNIQALTTLLESREADLSAEVEKTANLQAINDELNTKSNELEEANAQIANELDAAKENAVAIAAKSEQEIKDLKHELDVLCATTVCHPKPVTVIRHGHGHHHHC